MIPTVRYDKSLLYSKGCITKDLSHTYGSTRQNEVRKISKDVKEVSEKARQAFNNHQLSLLCDAPSCFPVFARALYQQGIRVKKVDDISNPKQMLITWDQDNDTVNPVGKIFNQPSEYSPFIFRSETTHYECRKEVLIAKSPCLGSLQDDFTFEKGVSNKTIKFLMRYLSGIKKSLPETLSFKEVGELIKYSKLFELKYLETLSKQFLIKKMSTSVFPPESQDVKIYGISKFLKSPLLEDLIQLTQLSNVEEILQFYEDDEALLMILASFLDAIAVESKPQGNHDLAVEIRCLLEEFGFSNLG